MPAVTIVTLALRSDLDKGLQDPLAVTCLSYSLAAAMVTASALVLQAWQGWQYFAQHGRIGTPVVNGIVAVALAALAAIVSAEAFRSFQSVRMNRLNPIPTESD